MGAEIDALIAKLEEIKHCAMEAAGTDKRPYDSAIVQTQSLPINIKIMDEILVALRSQQRAEPSDGRILAAAEASSYRPETQARILRDLRALFAQPVTITDEIVERTAIAIYNVAPMIDILNVEALRDGGDLITSEVPWEGAGERAKALARDRARAALAQPKEDRDAQG